MVIPLSTLTQLATESFHPHLRMCTVVGTSLVAWVADAASSWRALRRTGFRPCTVSATSIRDWPKFFRAYCRGGDEDPSFRPTFTKYPTSLTGPHDAVALPTRSVVWEAELVVISKRAHLVKEKDAWNYIVGLAVGQDISERTGQLRPPMPQFSLGKSFPGFAPTGPWVISPDEVEHRDDLAISCGLRVRCCKTLALHG